MDTEVTDPLRREMSAVKQSEDVMKFRSRISILLGCYTFLWGVWILIPSWDVFETSPVFASMREFMPERWWGINAMLAGAILTLGQSRKAVIWGSVAGVYHWGVVGTLYVVAEWKSTAWITAYTTALLIFGIYWLEKKEIEDDD